MYHNLSGELAGQCEKVTTRGVFVYGLRCCECIQYNHDNKEHKGRILGSARTKSAGIMGDRDAGECSWHKWHWAGLTDIKSTKVWYGTELRDDEEG